MRQRLLKCMKVVLCLWVLIGMVMVSEMTTNATEKIIAEGSCGENAFWKLTEDGVMTISGTGAMYDWHGDFAPSIPWYRQRDEIKSVIIKKGITSIGSKAFFCCENLETISIPKGVTEIGNSAFGGCDRLSSIVIPSGVKRIRQCLFSGCEQLKTIVLPEGIEEIETSAFANCENLTDITIPESVTDIGWSAFERCKSLKKIVIPKGVTRIETDLFYECIGLEEVILPEGINYIEQSAFYGCKKLKKIEIPKMVETIDNLAFCDCESLEKIVIPAATTLIGAGAFQRCSSLKEIIIPSNVYLLGACAFSGCSNLNKIIIPKSVTIIGGNCFANCNNLTIYCEENSYAHTYADKENIPYIIINGTTKNVVNVCVTAIDKSTNKEVPVPNAEVYLYVGEEERGYYTTDSEGYIEIPLDHLTEKEIQKATISAKKIVSQGKAINGTARDDLFEHFPKDEDGDYYRYTMELHSEKIDDKGYWVGASIPEMDKFTLNRELNLELSEPRMLVNLAVCYFADDETSQSGEYVMSIMKMLNQYSHRLAEATDAHIMIDKILLFSTDNRFDFYFREGEKTDIASMADIRIEAEVADTGVDGNNVIIHNNTVAFGYFSDTSYKVTDNYVNAFVNLIDADKYLGHQTFYRIISSGIDVNGKSMFDDVVNFAKTQVHETGHYLMGFRDEYQMGDGTDWGAYKSVTGIENFGLMDNQYEDSEISRNSPEYAYMNDAYEEVEELIFHTEHSWCRKGSCEDTLAEWMTNEDYTDEYMHLIDAPNVDFSVGEYKSNYSKVKGADDHIATYWYAELDDSDFLPVPSHDTNSISLVKNEELETTDLEEVNERMAFSDAVFTKESLADVSFAGNSSALKVTVKGNNNIAYAVSYRKAGEDSFRTAKLTNGTASLNISKGELAEVHINDSENYNCYYIERTPDTDTGYIYTSADNAVMAYVANDTDDSYTFIADNTAYTNGDYISMNQATWISSDSGKTFDSGEIYSVASYMAEIDYTTLTWFKYADGKWSALATDYSTEENRNIGARADLDGAGLYVLMAKPSSSAKVLAAKNLRYEQSEKRDAVVTLTFDDPNTNSKYYNVYYSDEPLTDKNADNVVVSSFDAVSTELTLTLLERGRTVYAGVEIVLEDGSRSTLGKITLTAGEADSDGDGIPDWYCSLHQLWGENGEKKEIAGNDDDGDGLTNLEEYRKGTDPKCTDDIIKNTNVVRLYGATRYETSYAIASALKRQMGIERFDVVIIVNGKNFPDALAGSYLAGVKDAPILMANEKYKDSLQSYIKANLKAGGTIYVLGGTAAVPGNVLNGLSGYDIKRLAGKNRYETNLLILEEAGVDGGEILICTGSTFADSLSASATGKPILLVKNKELTDGQLAFLKKHAGSQFYIIGGEGAVSRTIENAIKKYGTTKRIYGDSRYETSVEVAKAFFKTPDSAVLAYAKNFPDGLSGGPLVTEMNAPLILTSTGKIDAAAGYVGRYNIDKGFVLGGSSLISDAAVQKIF